MNWFLLLNLLIDTKVGNNRLPWRNNSLKNSCVQTFLPAAFPKKNM